jgi:OOP family OmpA-OmpF porin
MKKVLFRALVLICATTFLNNLSLTAQENDYNKWSLELKGGMHKPVTPFASGYYVDSPDFWQGSFGVRYMFNNYVGLRGEFGYNNLQGGENSMEFESNYYRASLQGVMNFGNLLRFSDWTNTFGLLVHAGAGYSINNPKNPIEFDSGDQMLHLVFGVSPQIRLGNRVALTTDFSFLTHGFQANSWDGTAASGARGFTGNMYNISVGLNFYIGKNEVHADWYSEDSAVYSELEEMDRRLSKIETDLIDSDQDGVPDYLDREPNTPSGVTVDTKGRAIDRNNNGIPDEMESALDARYATKDDLEKQNASQDAAVRDLINKGYVNVYFRFNSTTPETYSLQSVNYLIVYMKENPGAQAELIGYADEIGNAEYNQKLSERRAKAVYDLMIKAGIAENRLSYRGNGEDDTVDKDSANARQLVRRVTFRLK